MQAKNAEIKELAKVAMSGPTVTKESLPAPAASVAPAKAKVVKDKPLSIEKAQTAPVKPAAASDLPAIGGGGLPPVGGGFGASLGSLGGRAGRFEFDPEAKRRAAEELAKLNANFDSALPGEEEKKEEGQSL